MALPFDRIQRRGVAPERGHHVHPPEYGQFSRFSKTGSFAQSLTAIVLGLFVVGFVGFSHVEAVHNAAHDTRHANAFPCH